MSGLLVFLLFSNGFAMWCTNSDNHIYETFICSSFSDVGYEVSWSLGRPFTYTFSGECCFNSRDYYFIDPYYSSQPKICQIQSTSTINKLYLLESSPEVQWTFKLGEVPNNVHIILQNSRNSIKDGCETIIQILNQPILFFIECYERIKLDFLTDDRPYVYLGANEKYQSIGLSNQISGMKYIFSGINIDSTSAFGNSSVSSICTINQFSRYVQFDSSVTIKQDCSCFIVSTSTSVNFNEFSMNYPDCNYNNSLFDLTLLKNQVTLTFNDGAPFLWKSIIFQPRTEVIIVTITQPNTLILNGHTELPTQKLYIYGNVHFHSIKFPYTNVIHLFSNLSYDEVDFAEQTGRIIFVSPNVEKKGFEMMCENGIRSRFGYKSIKVCNCELQEGTFIQDDCLESSLFQWNQLDLIFKSQGNTYNGGAGSYWKTINTTSLTNLKGKINASSCYLNGKNTIYGSLKCNEIYVNGDLSIIGTETLKSDKIVVQHNSTIIGSIECSNFVIGPNINVIFENNFNSLINISINSNSFVTFKTTVSIDYIGVGENVQIKAERISFSHLSDKNKFSIVAHTLTVEEGRIVLGSVSLVNSMNIRSLVEMISIDAISFQALAIPFLVFEPTPKEIFVQSIPKCLSTSNIIFLYSHLRKIKGIAPELYSCDRQLIVINKDSNFIGCSTLGLSNKRCEYGDGTNTVYSCPCYGSAEVYCTLVISRMYYELSSDEFPNQIEVEKDLNLRCDSKEFILKTSSTVTLQGENNSIVFLSTQEPNGLIVSQKNMIFSFSKYGLSYSDNTVISSQIGLCDLIYSNPNQFECLKCKMGKYENGSCIDSIKIDNCRSISSVTQLCDFCEDYYFNDSTSCSRCYDAHCKHCNSTTCFVCDANYSIQGNLCKVASGCNYYVNGICYECPVGKYPLDGFCENCLIMGCLVCETNETCSICDVTNGYILDGSLCRFTNGTITHDRIMSCIEGFYELNNYCYGCSLRNCGICDDKMCLTCLEGYLLNNEGECVEEMGVCQSEDSRCVSCLQPTNYLNLTECVVCPEHCNKCLNDGDCVSCEEGYVLDKEFDDFDGVVVKCYSIRNDSNCALIQDGKCLTCKDSFYVSSFTCLECDYKCKKCANQADFCYECNDGFILENDHCVTSKDMTSNCKTFIGSTCIKCNSGYFINSTKCSPCPINCDICYRDNICSMCISDFFVNEAYQCESHIYLDQCIEYGNQGCLECEEGYYVKGKRCSRCDSKTTNCTHCDMNYGECQGCESEYVLVERECVHFTEIRHCLEAKNSECVMCDYWFEPSEKGVECDVAPVWWNFSFIIIIVVEVPKLCVIFGTALIHRIVKRVYKSKLEHEEKHNYTKFKIKYSNVIFNNTLESNISLNVSKLTFGCEEQPIGVGEEARELFCVANETNGTIKIYFNAVENKDKYDFEIRPSELILKKGEGCEFEALIKPHCTCAITDEFQISSSSLCGNINCTERIKIETFTLITTKLDPDELIEEKKLGEGSFGIVYKGIFKGNKVAIKKLKIVNSRTEEEQMADFTEEVSMLDKFRSEYIIHFYGAVFIPKKMCMVTEFAQFGSLQDLMNKMKEDNKELESKMKVKLLLDSAKGIQYLHSNGILHRDIKPDNFLVVSIDDNVPVNGKLTDFGTSRNINLLKANMTFTKGVGTPAYMAPEIFGQSHYETSADIYSFAVTMYQLFYWQQPYEKEKFQFPWNIASFIIKGDRLEKPDNMTNEQYQLISNCWKHEPRERMKIEDLTQQLKEMYEKYD